jgi:hypothetical protein
MKALLMTVALVAALLAACSDKGAEPEELARFSLNDGSLVQALENVFYDQARSADGGGSIRVECTEPTTVRLIETDQIDIEQARLIYQAMVRVERLEGRAYLEMWCSFPGAGEYFSRDLATPIEGPTDWTREETWFFLKKGQRPDRIKLNLVVEGTGTLWIDDIRLLKAPLG